jgi:D-tyrosyl-tRNA(Tyr) deacylase
MVLSKCSGGEIGLRTVVQRVSWSRVHVAGELTGEIDGGLCVLVGVTHGDGVQDVQWMAEKVANLRIFEDESGKMNRSVQDVGGGILLVSQFTLYGDARKGRRPSFTSAAPPEQAERLYDDLVSALETRGIRVQTGVFQAMMQVSLCNDGPVTIILDSKGVF